MNNSMKKNLVAIAAVALMMSLTACGGTNSGPDASGSPVGEGAVSSGQSSSQATTAPEILYGKVTSIVGNEVEVALIKLPDDELSADASSSEAGELPPVMDAVPMTPALPAGEAGVDVAQNTELTGETVTVTIPAGVSINNMGQEATLSALKKGNLVTIMVDSLEGLKVQGVNILG